MEYTSSRHFRILRAATVAACALLAIGLLLTSATDASATNPNPGILPPQSTPFGQSYGEWAADWWTWLIEAGGVPNGDETGEYCAVGQSGKVWFLAGEWGDEYAYQRECEVPAGKALFFPVQNYAWLSFPDDPYIGFPDVPEPGGEDAVRALLADANDGSGGRSATIDGVAVQDLDDYRVTSPEFYAQWPGWYYLGPNYDDGWYLMLAPLSVGEHTISFTGWDGNVDVTYDLTVVAGG